MPTIEAFGEMNGRQGVWSIEQAIIRNYCLLLTGQLGSYKYR